MPSKVEMTDELIAELKEEFFEMCGDEGESWDESTQTYDEVLDFIATSYQGSQLEIEDLEEIAKALFAELTK